MSAIGRRAWWLLPGLVAIFGPFSVGNIGAGIAFESRSVVSLTGRTVDQLQAESASTYRMPDFVVRSDGITFVILAIVLLAIPLVPYRAGQRWAWWTMWAFPAWMAAIFVLNIATGSASGQGPSDSATSAPVILVLSAAALLVDRTRFWPGGSAAIR